MKDLLSNVGAGGAGPAAGAPAAAAGGAAAADAPAAEEKKEEEKEESDDDMVRPRLAAAVRGRTLTLRAGLRSLRLNWDPFLCRLFIVFSSTCIAAPSRPRAAGPRAAPATALYPLHLAHTKRL